MGTFELLIVFAALMAVISLVAIAIDWVGRPLKNRRFIPRIYRYDDEVAPDEATPSAPMAPAPMAPAPMAPAMITGPPLAAGPPVVVTPPVMVPPAAITPPPATMAPAQPSIVKPPVAAAAIPAELAPRPPRPAATQPPSADSAPVADGSASPERTTSAFQDTIGHDGDGGLDQGGDGRGDGASGSPIRRDRGIAETVRSQSAAAWSTDMPLDARVDDANPSNDVKAERFWMATAEAAESGITHFDEVNLTRMRQGKPATRRNPRSGDIEAMELVGLRAASHRTDVRMKWPDETVDPWSST